MPTPKRRAAASVALALFAAIACAAPAPTAAVAPSIGGCPVLPANSIWNTPVDRMPVHPRSADYIASIGADDNVHADFGSGLWDGGPIGIPYVVVPSSQPRVDVSFEYDDESDAGLYPIPPNPPIEGGPSADGDRHILMVDSGACKLYELYAAYPNGDGTWRAGSGAIYDLRSNALRPDGWTSADAAGLPILPGLVRRDEVASGEITHALRFTAPLTQRAYVWPARHFASDDADPALPPMGQRFRLKADLDISGFSPDAQVILRALKKYGMILADNGSSWYISGSPDEGWDNDVLHELDVISGADFEAVDVSSLQVDPNTDAASPAYADTHTVAPGGAFEGQQVAYTLTIGGDGTQLALADTLPAGVSFVTGSLAVEGSTAGASYEEATRTIGWSGAPEAGAAVKISFVALIETQATQAIRNIARLTRGGETAELVATLIANPRQSFLPAVRGR